jgi:hypothetical protein
VGITGAKPSRVQAGSNPARGVDMKISRKIIAFYAVIAIMLSLIVCMALGADQARPDFTWLGMMERIQEYRDSRPVSHPYTIESFEEASRLFTEAVENGHRRETVLNLEARIHCEVGHIARKVYLTQAYD